MQKQSRKFTFLLFLNSIISAIAFLNFATAQTKSIAHIPAAVYTDPIAEDVNFPARDAVVHIPVKNVKINGLFLLAAGKGPHPTMILFHGVPGNEKNLDLAQAVRRNGWNVLTLNYRGSWGSPGAFSFAGNLEDADAALAFVRKPTIQQQFNINEKYVVLAGHSMGGWVCAMTAAHHPDLFGVIMISAANMGGKVVVQGERSKIIAWMADNYETLAGTSPEIMADEVIKNKKQFDMKHTASDLKTLPLLIIYSNDSFSSEDQIFAKEVKNSGNNQVTQFYIPTNHSYSDRRVELISVVINWLNLINNSARSGSHN